MPGIVSRSEASSRVPRGALWLVGCVILLGPALWNGFALLQYDTGGYLARWYEGYLVPSRPGAYGVLLWAGAPSAFWSVLILQAIASIWIVGLLLRDLGFGRRPGLVLAVLATLSLITTLPFLASTLLTDIFAGLMVIALHLLTFGRTPTRGERGGLIALIAFAAAAHNATFMLLLALAGAGLALAVVRPHLIPASRAAVLLAVMLASLAAMLIGNFSISRRIEMTPGSYGILFGRMLEAGIVPRYLAEHCPDPRLRLCARRDEIPPTADAFLWGQGVFNDLGRFTGLNDEMRAIVFGSLRAYPAAQLRAALNGTAEQLTRVRSGEGVVDRLWHTYAIIEHYTPSLVPAVRAARQQRGYLGFDAINRIHVPVGLLSAALLPFLLLLGGREPALAATRLFAGSLLLALLVNAFVCGAIANPHDRYGARLIWLAPLTIILAVLSLHASSTANWLRERVIGAPPRQVKP